MRTGQKLAAGWIFFLLMIGCARPKPEPELASSVESPVYANHFPEELAALKKEMSDQQREAREVMKRFPRYPEELREPSWEHVIAVVRLANDEGRSQGYVSRLEESRAIERFFAEEGQEIDRKVAGAANYAAKKKNCEADVGSQAAFALNKTVEERLEKRLRQHSDAHALIEQNKDELGDKNIEKVEDQADAISRASYLAYVGVVRTKVELRQRTEEIDQVAGTLDRIILELTDRSKGTENDADRQRIEERLAAARKAKAELEREAPQARELAKQSEEEAKALQQEHEAAFRGLLDQLETLRAQAAQVPGSGT